MVDNVVVLRIWGYMIEFAGFEEIELREIFDTFAGAVEYAADNIASRLVMRKFPVDIEDFSMHAAIPRHRGGSAAAKYLIDGTLFPASNQARDIVPIHETPAFSCYAAGRALVIASDTAILFLGRGLPDMLLSDVIENWLLYQAREEGSLMVHCSAWISEGRVKMLVGDSGVGKTTRLFREIGDGAKFFSNDRAFLRLNRDALEVKSFPLPVNVGCGTIRALGLELPHYGMDDQSKIRLTASQVLENYGGDYQTWYPVESISCRSEHELQDNLFWDEDPCHPFWNKTFSPQPFGSRRAGLEDAIRRRTQILETSLSYPSRPGVEGAVMTCPRKLVQGL